MKFLKRLLFIFVFIMSLVTTACSNVNNEEQIEKKHELEAKESKTKESKTKESKVQEPTKHVTPEVVLEMPKENVVDYSQYFNGVLGSAVFYTPNNNTIDIYETTIANERHSPCSTFKIISSLVGMEKGVIDYENNIRKWSGEEFWNSAWNGDISFLDAFQSSCIWYFREVIDQVGPEQSTQVLNELEYGNQDISDWNGGLNTNNKNPALTGFWVESSLLITPIEQTKVLSKIFEPGTLYKKESTDLLKRAMLVETNSIIPIYGKTGTGKLKNVLLDAWFVGFFTQNNENTYFAIYLGETDNPEISSLTAKEIALQIIGDIYQKDIQ